MKPLRSNKQKEGLARYPNWKASSLKFFSCPFSPLPRQTLLSYSSENHKNTPDMPRSLQTRHVNEGISPPTKHTYPSQTANSQIIYLSSRFRGLPEVYLKELTRMQAVFTKKALLLSTGYVLYDNL